MKRNYSYLIGNQFAKGNKPNKTSFRKGHKTWNKNKTDIYSEKTRVLMSKNHANVKGENNPNWKDSKTIIICQIPGCNNVREVYKCEIDNGGGKYCSRKCAGLAKSNLIRGENNPNYGREHTKEELIKMREKHIEYLSSGKHKFKETGIELKIEKELKRVNLNYKKQIAICKVGVVDFFLPEYDIIIEADGDYWHNLPDYKQRDATKNLIFSFNGYKVFRFWEHEINESPKNCIKKVLRHIKELNKCQLQK